MEKLNRLLLPAAILIASIILGGFYYASQVNKQKPIERQQQITIEQQVKKEAVAEEIQKKKQECSAIARNAFESYKNLRKHEDGSSNWSYSYEMFGYSPSFDTCVFSTEEVLRLDVVIDSRIIVDAYTNREIISWTVWHGAIEDMRKKEGSNSPIVANFDSEQKVNKETFQRIYDESF